MSISIEIQIQFENLLKENRHNKLLSFLIIDFHLLFKSHSILRQVNRKLFFTQSSFAIPATPPSRRLTDTDNFVIPKTVTAANINTVNNAAAVNTTTINNNSTQKNGIGQTATQTNSTSTITIESNSIQLSKNLNKQTTASIEKKDATLIELLKRGTKVYKSCH